MYANFISFRFGNKMKENVNENEKIFIIQITSFSLVLLLFILMGFHLSNSNNKPKSA